MAASSIKETSPGHVQCHSVPAGPRDVASAAQLQVTRSGSDPVAVPFNDSEADVDRTFAAYAFSEPVPYSAQIIGADGAVLATWSATP